MKDVLVTGANGFVGRNLVQALSRRHDVGVRTFTRHNTLNELSQLVEGTDTVFHLAGVNRPESEREFEEVNVGLTRNVLEAVEATGGKTHVILSSSTQAAQENPYGRSKRAAENLALSFAERSSIGVSIYRLPGVFGKWSTPHYNTVVATFCHQIARGEPVVVSDSSKVLELAYVDDVVDLMSAEIDARPTSGVHWRTVAPTFEITLGKLAATLRSIARVREGGDLPDLSDPMTKRLYGTFTSFVPPEDWATPVRLKSDERGWLFELVKSSAAGQVFVSKTEPGFTRGNHYHDTKVEKFCVVDGEAVIRLRPIEGGDVISFVASGDDIRVVDIPVGYTHSIENTGSRPVTTLFWASEIFDPENPDTHGLEV